MRSRRHIGTFVRVDTSGYRGQVHVREDGPADGEVLVLIHGFSGSMHWYDLVVPLLSDTYRIIRVDLLGHGSTRGPAVDAPVQAGAVAAVLEALDITGATAVGHSFGADVAVELAETSERITRLVIVAQAPDYSDANLPRGGRIMTMPVIGTTLHGVAKPLVSVVSVLAGRASKHPQGRQLAAHARSDFNALRTGMFKVVLLDRGARMALDPLDVQLARAGKPTLVILGGQDHFYGARSEARYRAVGASVEVLLESGHSPLVEMPVITARLLRSWLSGARAAS